MRQQSIALLLLFSSAVEIKAQTTNCMAMGGGLAHCDTIGSNGLSSTDCMAMGSTMVNCNTIGSGGLSAPQSYPNDGGFAAGQAIGNMINRLRENSFRKKVGQMVASGDCQGAAQLALSKGRVEMGTEIAQSCRQARQSTSGEKEISADPATLEDQLRRMATSTRTPIVVDRLTTISKVEAIGTQLLFTATVASNDMTMSDATRSRLINNICAYKSSPPLLRAGATIRVVYFQPSGHQIGAAMATRQECGF